jgi:hypothetical protein
MVECEEAAKTQGQFSISGPTRSCRIITQGKEDGGDTTTRGKEKGGVVRDGERDDGGVKRREHYWVSGGQAA